ncbi:PqiC family protein [Rheinheimera sp. UJ63]|uniref:PqiC family protein n=1 Tax=Rheinheimera sp. UJ63 TaxID=2910157 RepID=UPI001F2C02A3|nr:ABC-type transport auxiliary lipoprotein family protein [Rheinheimera sp. UJ63]MCF4008152.1 ABC-type transport auxiliary lipoprotein family protein [Rheinheimera sp. UJ63]
MKLHLLVILALLITLSACSNTVNGTRYYQVAAPSAKPVEPAAIAALAIAPVRVASYLNGSGLVVQQSTVEFSIARQHLWTDSLEQQLQRQLTEYLLTSVPKLALLPQPTAQVALLRLDIDRFYADAAGQAVVSGRYSISDEQRVQTQAFLYQVPLADAGYPAMVNALSIGWQQLLQDITLAVQQH